MLIKDHYRVGTAEKDLRETLRWIHFELHENELRRLCDQVESRLLKQADLPLLEARCNQQLMAACYFVKLPGSVASLGGLRVSEGCESLADDLLQQFLLRLREQGVSQIQALVPQVVNDASKSLARCGFQLSTVIRHLWFDLTSSTHGNSAHVAHCELIPVFKFTQKEVGALLDATFEKTLDCAFLSGHRTGLEVLFSLLDDRPWNEQLPWWILAAGDKLIGCVFIASHPESVSELLYLGLIAEQRGRGLGRVLAQHAIKHCAAKKQRLLVTAVDAKNQPALDVYLPLGFQHHRQMNVWWYPKQI